MAAVCLLETGGGGGRSVCGECIGLTIAPDSLWCRLDRQAFCDQHAARVARRYAAGNPNGGQGADPPMLASLTGALSCPESFAYLASKLIPSMPTVSTLLFI